MSSQGSFFLDVDTHKVMHPETNLMHVASIHVGTIDGEFVGCVEFTCPICQNKHQVSALMPKALTENESIEEVASGTMFVTLQLSMDLVCRAIKEAHNVDIDMNITFDEEGGDDNEN